MLYADNLTAEESRMRAEIQMGVDEFRMRPDESRRDLDKSNGIRVKNGMGNLNLAPPGLLPLPGLLSLPFGVSRIIRGWDGRKCSRGIITRQDTQVIVVVVVVVVVVKTGGVGRVVVVVVARQNVRFAI
jgi:hypothetical protein